MLVLQMHTWAYLICLGGSGLESIPYMKSEGAWGYNDNRGWRLLGERPLTACSKLVRHRGAEFDTQRLHGHRPWENIMQWTSGLGHASLRALQSWGSPNSDELRQLNLWLVHTQ